MNIFRLFFFFLHRNPKIHIAVLTDQLKIKGHKMQVSIPKNHPPVTLTAHSKDADGNPASAKSPLVWSSSDESKVSVAGNDTTAVATIVGAGTATISARDDLDNVTGTIDFVVDALPVASIEITADI